MSDDTLTDLRAKLRAALTDRLGSILFDFQVEERSSYEVAFEHATIELLGIVDPFLAECAAEIQRLTENYDDLAQRSDPSGDVRRARVAEETARALFLQVEELEAEIQRLTEVHGNIARAWRDGAVLAGHGQPMPSLPERITGRSPAEIAAFEEGFAFIHHSDVAREMAGRIHRIAERAEAAEAQVASLTAERDDARALFAAHTAAVRDFLNELYAVMVDPCATEAVTVEATKTALLAAAIRDRETVATVATLTARVQELEKLVGIRELLRDRIAAMSDEAIVRLTDELAREQADAPAPTTE